MRENSFQRVVPGADTVCVMAKLSGEASEAMARQSLDRFVITAARRRASVSRVALAMRRPIKRPRPVFLVYVCHFDRGDVIKV